MKASVEQLTASSSNLARLLNISLRRVQQLVQAGLIPPAGPNGHRLIDAVPAYLRLVQRPTESKNLTQARQKLLEVQTAIRQVELRQKSGELVSRAAVEQEWFQVARNTRDNLQNIPPRVAGLLAAERNQDKIFQLLTREINQCLEGLSNGYAESVPRIPSSGSSPHRKFSTSKR